MTQYYQKASYLFLKEHKERLQGTERYRYPTLCISSKEDTIQFTLIAHPFKVPSRSLKSLDDTVFEESTTITNFTFEFVT